MERKDGEENPTERTWQRIAYGTGREKQPAVAGARDTVPPGGHNGRGNGIQTLGKGPPQAGIGTHGHEANHFIGTRGSN